VTVLPSPLPHPLDRPVDVPAWARPALEWVVGFDWPPGDEVATWDVADRWYTLADALTGPRALAAEAAAEIISGYGRADIGAAGFLDAWHRLSGDESAPLNALVQVVHELGELVDAGGRDIEAAKLEAWIEIGIFLTELSGIAVAGALTLGAATPAAGGLIAATRIAVQQIFERLGAQLTGAATGGEVEPPATVTSPVVTLPRHRATRSSSRSASRALLPPDRSARSSDVSSNRATQPPDRATRSPNAVSSRATKPPDGAAHFPNKPSGRATQPSEGAAHSSGAPSARVTRPPDRASLRSERPTLAPEPAAPPRDGSRRTHDRNRRVDYSRYLTSIAEQTWSIILDLERFAVSASRLGSLTRGEAATIAAATDAAELRAVELRAIVADLEARTDLVRSGKRERETAGIDPPAWARIEAYAGVDDRFVRAEPGSPWEEEDSPWADGGLRVPLRVPQRELEDAMPRDGDGRVRRLADPRQGRWFSLVNGGGPTADPTRGLNCLDAVLALFDTYVRGCPRVSAPRTVDVYAHGDPNRPLGGEDEGVRRIELATGGGFQNLCPFVGGAEPDLAKPPVDAALRNLANHLHNTGHGAFAFIVTDLDSGGCHCWAAVNQAGTILFLDPQVGSLSEEAPLYRHHGLSTKANIVSMDALVVDGEGRPALLPYHGAGQWSAASPTDATFKDPPWTRPTPGDGLP